MPTQEQREKFMEIRDAAKLAGIKQPEKKFSKIKRFT